MTEARTPEVESCASCGTSFKPQKLGHIFCSVECRHRGRVEPHLRVQADPEAIERLFDPSRDIYERVRADDWCPYGGEVAALYAFDTVEGRRRWYSNLRARRLTPQASGSVLLSA